MTTFTTRVAASLAVAAIATSAVADAAEDAGPTFDMSTVQDVFKIGFLGDEAAQDVIARNECLKDYVAAAYWICPVFVPLQVLVCAALRSKATGLFHPNAECRRRGL